MLLLRTLKKKGQYLKRYGLKDKDLNRSFKFNFNTQNKT